MAGESARIEVRGGDDWVTRNNMGATIRGLADVSPRTLAIMHGPSFSGDGAAALRALADDYDRRISGRGVQTAKPAS